MGCRSSPDHGIEPFVPPAPHALRSRKKRGLYAGQSPWGMRIALDGVTLEIDEHERNVIAAVHHMRSNGYKLRQIVASLKELGVVGRTGKPIGMTRAFEIIHGGRKRPEETATAKVRATRARSP